MSSTALLRIEDDRTARARIRDAAIAQFGAHGVAGTSLRVVAEEAGVSQPLVIHHFGSKQGLRVACDEHAAATIRSNKRMAVAQGPQLDALAALRTMEEGLPILRYLARTLTDNSPHVAALIDEMVDDAVDYMEEGVRTGMLKPSDRPRERATVLVMWSFGALTLHEHVRRLLGADLTADMEGMTAYGLPAAEILAHGVLAEGVYERMRDALTHPREDGA